MHVLLEGTGTLETVRTVALSCLFVHSMTLPLPPSLYASILKFTVFLLRLHAFKQPCLVHAMFSVFIFFRTHLISQVFIIYYHFSHVGYDPDGQIRLQIRAFSGVTTKQQSPGSLMSHANLMPVIKRVLKLMYADHDLRIN